MENKFKEIFVKRNRFFPVVAYTTEVVGSDKYIEIAAVEQLKAELHNLEQLNSEYKGLHEEAKRMRSEIRALKSKLKIAVTCINDIFNKSKDQSHIEQLSRQALTEIGGEI